MGYNGTDPESPRTVNKPLGTAGNSVLSKVGQATRRWAPALLTASRLQMQPDNQLPRLDCAFQLWATIKFSCSCPGQYFLRATRCSSAQSLTTHLTCKQVSPARSYGAGCFSLFCASHWHACSSSSSPKCPTKPISKRETFTSYFANIFEFFFLTIIKLTSNWFFKSHPAQLNLI